MDFSFSEEQRATSDLARQILGERSTHERLRELELLGEYYDAAIWTELARSDLLGISLPTEFGGSGLGFFETYLVLEEVGRYTAMVPVLPVIVMGAMPIAEFGTTAQRSSLLPPMVRGELLVTAALVETTGDLARPMTTARRDGDGWIVDGAKTCVPAGLIASRVLVPASIDDGGVGVFVVDADAPGVSRYRQEPTNGISEARIEFDGVRVGADDVLGEVHDGAKITEWITQRATAGLCAIATGVCEDALRRTAEYTKSREQFGRPIATFQAVGQRAADAYIDTDAVRITGWQAAWRLANGRSATRELAIAKFWAADGGQRVVHTAQHLHGGIGIDLEYPLHRYFLWAKHLELTLGGATSQLLTLGSLLAAEAV